MPATSEGRSNARSCDQFHIAFDTPPWTAHYVPALTHSARHWSLAQVVGDLQRLEQEPRGPAAVTLALVVSWRVRALARRPGQATPVASTAPSRPLAMYRGSVTTMSEYGLMWVNGIIQNWVCFLRKQLIVARR